MSMLDLTTVPDYAKAHGILPAQAASLIAAAPELLEALKGMLADIESGCGLKDAMDHARAIIAKAEGSDNV